MVAYLPTFRPMMESCSVPDTMPFSSLALGTGTRYAKIDTDVNTGMVLRRRRCFGEKCPARELVSQAAEAGEVIADGGA